MATTTKRPKKRKHLPSLEMEDRIRERRELRRAVTIKRDVERAAKQLTRTVERANATLIKTCVALLAMHGYRIARASDEAPAAKG